MLWELLLYLFKARTEIVHGRALTDGSADNCMIGYHSTALNCIIDQAMNY